MSVTSSQLSCTVPAEPVVTSAERLSGTSAIVQWIPITYDEARGLLTSLEIVYEPVKESSCAKHYFKDSETLILTQDLFGHSEATISGLAPSHEYCIAIRASTNGGKGGYSNIVKLLCKFRRY